MMVAIASGATGLDPAVFVLSSIVASGIRFYAVAGLLYRFGPSVRAFIERRLGIIFKAEIVALLGGFAFVRLGV